MASPQLDEQARRAQVELKRDTFDAIDEVWPLLDLRRLGRTFGPWLTAVGSVVADQREESARLAREYVLAAKDEAGVPGELTLPPLADLAHDRLVGNLLVSVARAGRFARAAPGSVQAARAADAALVRAQGAASRLALEAGRQVIVDVVDEAPALFDRPAQRDLRRRARDRNPGPRWYRTTAGNACEFCRMLAGRGAVYREDSVTFRSHDHCACGAGIEFE